jgi:hypothetical protein
MARSPRKLKKTTLSPSSMVPTGSPAVVGDHERGQVLVAGRALARTGLDRLAAEANRRPSPWVWQRPAALDHAQSAS